MSRVLLIAYHYPPVGGAGVQRAVKLVRYLPEHGWETTVVTGRDAGRDRWTPTDSTLGSEIDHVARTVRVATHPPVPGTWSARADRWLGRRGAWSSWWTAAVADAAYAAACDSDVILATMSPFESARAAAELSRSTGVPWVADLRDPWALDEMTAYPTGAHRRLALRRMRADLATASAIIMNTPEAAVQVRRTFPELAPAVVQAVPNGYDASDFAGQPPDVDPRALRIVHAGYLHTGLGRRGRIRRMLEGSGADVDRGTRSHVYLMRALEQLGTGTARPVELHLAGVLSDADRAAIPAGVDVRVHGYLTHSEAVGLMRSADLLFLPMHDLPPGRRATIVPGKTYEYLASGRPILAAVPDGDARDLLVAAAGVHLCRPADVEAMARIVAFAASRPHAVDVDRSDVLRPFRREQLAARVASVLESVARPRPEGGSPPVMLTGVLED